MRVFLRHGRTGYYYRGNAEWTIEPEDAGDFGSLERALQVIETEHLGGLSIIVRHREGGPDQIFDLSTGTPVEILPEQAKPV